MAGASLAFASTETSHPCSAVFTACVPPIVELSGVPQWQKWPYEGKETVGGRCGLARVSVA